MEVDTCQPQLQPITDMQKFVDQCMQLWWQVEKVRHRGDREGRRLEEARNRGGREETLSSIDIRSMYSQLHARLERLHCSF